MKTATQLAKEKQQKEGFKPGDKVKWNGGSAHYTNHDGFIVVQPHVGKAFEKEWPTTGIEGEIHVIGLNDGDSYSFQPDNLVKL
tara:strand:- start:54 stop:305 length:252 start_codon:yes stop_codon:yes gene_type:complete